jgi:hypothetical protein
MYEAEVTLVGSRAPAMRERRMSWRSVDGVAVPDPVAGLPALDFCNIRAGWGTAGPREYLVSFEALAIWAREVTLLPPGAVTALLLRPGPAGDQVLRRALQLRESLYPVLLGRGTGADWAVISAEATLAGQHQRLVPTDPPALPTADPPAAQAAASAARGRWELVPDDDPDLVIAAIAVEAADLLVSRPAGAVSACPGEGCGWLFSDPRGRRRWCSMAVCGNRAKARRFAARHG